MSRRCGADAAAQPSRPRGAGLKQQIVESMGGKLELLAQFPNRPPVVIERLGVNAKAGRKTRAAA
jgi:hypothetical protein